MARASELVAGRGVFEIPEKAEPNHNHQQLTHKTLHIIDLLLSFSLSFCLLILAQHNCIHLLAHSTLLQEHSNVNPFASDGVDDEVDTAEAIGTGTGIGNCAQPCDQLVFQLDLRHPRIFAGSATAKSISTPRFKPSDPSRVPLCHAQLLLYRRGLRHNRPRHLPTDRATSAPTCYSTSPMSSTRVLPSGNP